MRRTIVKSLIVLVCGLWCAQVSTRAQCGVLENWEFHLTPYLWLPAMDVDSTVSGVTTSLDLSFGDIVDKFSIFGVSGRLEMWNRDLGFSLDKMYISLEGDFSGQAPGRTIPFPSRPIKIPGLSFQVDVDIGNGGDLSRSQAAFELGASISGPLVRAVCRPSLRSLGSRSF